MKKYFSIISIFFVFVLAVAAIPVLGAQDNSAPEAWYWQTTHTVEQAWNASNVVVIVEGEVGSQVPPNEWNVYNFSDGGMFTLRANFGDGVPASAIPQNKTVRIVGKANNGEVSVEGLEIMEALPVSPDATAAGVNSGTYTGQDISLQGTIGNKQSGPPPNWNYYDFTDATGTTTVDLPDQDEFPSYAIPTNRTSMIFGKAKNFNGHRVDSELILLHDFGGNPPTSTPLPPTATPTLPPGVTPTATNTPNPSAPPDLYLPMVKKQAYVPPTATPLPPTATPPAPTGWVWNTTHTVSQINANCCDGQVVVVEGTVGNQITSGGIPASWKYFEFSAGGASTVLDFDDEIPTSAIPQGVTVRVLGEPGTNNNVHKIEVDGLQTLGSVSVSTNATAIQINNGSFDGLPVTMVGRFGDLTNSWYLWFEFSDNTGTTTSDIGNNDISPSLIPTDRNVAIFGEGGEDFGWYKVDTEYILIAAGY